jgi:hypothetical protein
MAWSIAVTFIPNGETVDLETSSVANSGRKNFLGVLTQVEVDDGLNVAAKEQCSLDLVVVVDMGPFKMRTFQHQNRSLKSAVCA